ncbi:rab-GTPase-TBC domain-containing protein [Triangularia verruculosa]|uniref:Rab-GTPase-TBC domain-containing protein n=1 Tax=Triangularia verruculosa TaxID=2587418 RepID=A0AAN6XB81_9PEZI|nr:rab-GTPase-TBC domain-containing protein [Triangularia verruculosa]
MEPDQIKRDEQRLPNTQKATKPTMVTTPTANEMGHERTTSEPIPLEMQEKARDHDSLVTVRLSEPPSLTVNTSVPPSTITSRYNSVPSKTIAETLNEEDDDDDDSESEIFEPDSRKKKGPSLQDELGEAEDRRSNGVARDSTSSSDSDAVDWDKLQATEDMEARNKQNAQASTASLLARLEQENNKIATNPKSIKVKIIERQPHLRESHPRPPSMAQLRKMVTGPTPPALRYSTLPPTPMTELEFYLALVKDPQQTAARLPTLLSNKVRKGIPPPLRGVVWQSMAGARDSALEEVFERLSGESSPYEGVISKDLGRSFPGVDMFRDPEGDGQRMLGRVLKCFSLYDTKIGYCQGLAFLVGPLLMHMGDKQAFCVLVRLMENYDLRHCFVPDLAGLHVRIYQFRELLRQHLPTLSTHLDELQVEPAYVSQWFLSFFAVTCPLPMLFRIYDVIFAEGASETIMRVALSLMRKNQGRILACTELEDVMHLLLSRGLWDCYNYNADEFVQDFAALSEIVTKARLAALEQGYREAKISPDANPRGTDATAQQVSDVTTAASRFLGRLWASSSTPRFATFAAASSASPASNNSTTNTNTNTNTLNPGFSAVSRPLSMLRRSTSKQSLASTFNSMEVGSSTTSSAASVLSSVSTDATSISRDSSTDDSTATAAPQKTAPTVFPSGANSSKEDRQLHSQIEDLLTALSELQRNHTLLASQLQKEKEDRDEDRKAVRSLLDGLRKRAGGEDSAALSSSIDSDGTIRDASAEPTSGEDDEAEKPTSEQLSDLLDIVELRFSDSVVNRRSSMAQTKPQLRDELARAKEQLSHEVSRSREHERKIHEVEQEVSSLKEQLRESHTHVRTLHQEKQRLEKQIHGMRIRASDTPASNATSTEWFPQIGTAAGTSGLRELKLGRSRSTPSHAHPNYNQRASSMTMQKKSNRDSAGSTLNVVAPPPPPPIPTSESDALLLELAAAKTAEAVAKQEAEEAKQKLEQLRKAFGLAPGETPPALQRSHSTADGGGPAAAAMGMFGRLTGTAGPTSAPGVGESPQKAATAPTATNASGGGGFWGWRR